MTIAAAPYATLPYSPLSNPAARTLSSNDAVRTALVVAHHLCHSLGGSCRLTLVLGPVHNVISMVDRQNLLAIEPDLEERLIFLGQPEFADLLVLPHKVRALNPERKLLRGMPFDPDNGI